MVTVENLLKADALEELRIISGKAGLGREIRSISVMDAPDSYKWLKGGELILTTGYLFGDDAWLLEHFVNNLIEAGSAGLGIKKGRFIHEIPPSVLALTEKNKFPLIEIPHRFGWSEVISAFYELLHNIKNAGMLEPDSIEELYSAARRGSGRLMEKMSKLFHIPLAIVLNNKKIKADNGLAGVDLIGTALKDTALFPDNMGEETLNVGQQFLAVLKIPLSRNDGAEYLAIMADNRAFLSEMRKLFHLLSGLGAQESVVSSDRENIYRKFILDLQSGKISNKEITALQKYRGLHKAVYSGIILIQAENTTEVYKALQKTLKDARLLKWGKANTHIVDNAAQKEAVVMIEFYPHEEESADGWQFILYEEMEYCFQEMERGLMGIGSFYERLEDIALSYEESRASLRIGKILWKDKYCFWYALLSAYDVLLKTGPSYLNLNYIKTLNDNQAGLQFDGIETLEAYVDCGGYKKAAAKLFVHENTLRYRIQKIKDILHLDMDDPVVGGALIIQVNLWRLLRADLL